MAPQDAEAALAGHRESELDLPLHRGRAEHARRAVAERRPSFGVDGVVTESQELQARQAKLAENQVLASILASGARLALVDLRRVCALQSGVLIDDDAMPELDPDDLDALLAYTIRPPELPKLEIQYDVARRAWILLAPDPNLRVVREFRTELEEGGIGLGFEIRQFGSSVRAAKHRDRYLLVDGYHRAVRLLERGIHVVPALVSDLEPGFVRRGAGIRPELYLGERPPLLPDFWDDEVSAETPLPAATRVLVVEALDIRPWG